jgi:hypothetical protein
MSVLVPPPTAAVAPPVVNPDEAASVRTLFILLSNIC